MKKIVLKYDGRCVKCGRISAGKGVYWEKDKGVFRHLLSRNNSTLDLTANRLSSEMFRMGDHAYLTETRLF